MIFCFLQLQTALWRKAKGFHIFMYAADIINVKFKYQFLHWTYIYTTLFSQKGSNANLNVFK